MGVALHHDPALMHQWYNVDKLTPVQIAKKLGVTERTVYRSLKKMGYIKK